MLMRLAANENVPREAVLALRGRGHDVVWIHEAAPGSADDQVLRRAHEEGRLLVTLDTDFGDLAYRLGLAASPGIALFRVECASAADLARFIVSSLESRTDWLGSFSVVEADRVRIRPLPAPR